MESLSQFQSDVISCKRCPRLTGHTSEIATVKRRQYQNEEYWGRPVPSFGDPQARIWLLGLAPGNHGANRTGRMFTGDSSGDWVFKALHHFGFASSPQSIHRTDRLKLQDVWISAAVRCAPPQNRPLPKEIEKCRPYLDREFHLLKNLRLILATGSIAFGAACKLLERQGYKLPKVKFSHGACYQVGDKTLLASYHPSRQNTQTGRLTEKMWFEIFKTAKRSYRE